VNGRNARAAAFKDEPIVPPLAVNVNVIGVRKPHWVSLVDLRLTP